MTGNQLKINILKNGFQLTEVANRLNITPQALQSKLNSKDLTLSFIQKIANCINKSVYQLADMTSDESGENGGLIKSKQEDNLGNRVKNRGQSRGFVTDSVTKPSHSAYKLTENINVVREESTEHNLSRMPKVITISPSGADNILYVPVRAQAGYLTGHGDQEYIESLQSFRMPGLDNSTYRMFEVSGISMVPTLSDKDKVIGQWVERLDEIRENRVHIVILKDGVLVKRVLNRIKERGKIYLKSDTLTHRSNYPIMEVDASDVLEIWYVRMKVSGDLSEPSEIYSRVADLEINLHAINKVLKAQNLLE